MLRKITWLILAAALIAGLLPSPAHAQDGGPTTTQRAWLNMRAGPGTGYTIITTLAPGTPLVVEARNTADAWILAHTADNAFRGWMARRFVRNISGTSRQLPVSNEVIAVAPPPTAVPVVASSGPTSPDLGSIDLGGFDASRVAGIDLAAYPIVGRATARTYAIYRDGRARGNNAHYLSKVGDCFSEHEYFLKHFAWDKYGLGEYDYLQTVIDHFGESLAAKSYAASVGFLAGAVLDKQWADPAICLLDESPLLCEYRVNKPAVAVIMFGTQDLLLMTPEQFNGYLREVVRETIDAGVIPVLSTFPGNLGMWDKTLLYNQIVVRIALDFDIPLINLWLALEQLPNHGLGEDGNHLSWPITTAGDMTYPNLDTGYPMRNLVTLQTLDVIRRDVLR